MEIYVELTEFIRQIVIADAWKFADDSEVAQVIVLKGLNKVTLILNNFYGMSEAGRDAARKTIESTVNSPYVKERRIEL